MSNRAWVTLATNDSYGLGALVLAHSLRRAGSNYPAVVLITPAVTDAMRERLGAVFAEVITVNVLDSRDETHLALLQRPELGITFTKLHCWSLTQYDKCVFLDADALIVQNCDELFEREELSAAPDVGWPDCFNSGVFVFSPSADTYSKLITFAKERGSFDGGDQGLLNAFFSDWAHGDINKHLPFLYNVTSAAFYSYLPALKHYGQGMKIIHFIGATKPWLQRYNWESGSVDAPEHLRELLQLWWDLFVGQVHTKLDTTMSTTVEAEEETPPQLPPQDVQEYYAPKLDPESEFTWHHPETQIPHVEDQVVDMSEFYDPWEHYRGTVLPPSHLGGSNIKGLQEEEELRKNPWQYQHTQENNHSHHNHYIADAYRYQHYTNHEQSNHEENRSENNNKHSELHNWHQGLQSHLHYLQQHEHNFPDHRDHYDAPYSEPSFEHQNDNDEHGQYSQHFHSSENCDHNDNSSQNFQKWHVLGYHTHSSSIDPTNNSDHHHNQIHNRIPRNETEVYRVHLDIKRQNGLNRGARRLPVLHETVNHMTNGHGSDSADEEHEFIIPRHPYDGFYLRHVPTVNSRGRKICLHEIPPTPIPSSPDSESLPPSPPPNKFEEEVFETASECEYQSGVAGNLARVVLGSAGYPRDALDELTRRQGWEAGNIDYMGADSFENIWTKISQTLSQSRILTPKTPPREPSPPKEQLEAPVAEPVQTPETVAAEPPKEESVEVPKTEAAVPATPPATPVPSSPVTETLPKVEVVQSQAAPAPQEVPCPAPQAAPSPAPKAAPTPAPQATPSPVPQAPLSPAPQAPLSPAPQAALSPAIQAAPSPAPQRPPSPAAQAAPSPAPIAAPSPTHLVATPPATQVSPQVTPEKLGATLSTDSPPLVNTPSKENAPTSPAAKSEERRKPAGKLLLSAPATVDAVPTPDSELEDAASLAHAIIAGELRATVTSPSPSADAPPPLPLQEQRLSAQEPEVPTPPVSLAQIGVKPKGKASTAAQIELSVTEKDSPTPATPSTPSEPNTPDNDAPKKKVVKKVVKKVAPAGEAPTPVPPPRKKEKKPKEK